MPVTLHPVTAVSDVERAQVARVVSDLTADHIVNIELQKWQLTPDDYHLYSALFNQRMVGFILLQGGQLKALAVHPATRNRGVGSRMLAELKRQCPEVRVTPPEPAHWLNRHG